jgi:hypothetical protein
LVGKAEDRRTLERSERRLEDNIKVDLRENVLEDVDWILELWLNIGTSVRLL